MDEQSVEMQSNRRILVVDDEPELVRLMVKVLAKVGYEVDGTSETAEALRMVENDRSFAAVISDFMMPGMNGLDLSKKIREFIPHVIIILVTGTAHQMTDCEAIAQGVQHVLRKPFLPSDLRALVQSVIK